MSSPKTTKKTASAIKESGEASTSNDISEREKKLQTLRKRLRESEDQSFRDVLIEQRSKKTSAALIKRQERRKDQAEQLLAQKETAEKGLDWERVKWTTYSIEDVERWEEMKEVKKLQVNDGFTDYTQTTHKKYQGLINKLKPDLQEYNANKAYTQEVAAASSSGSLSSFYREANSLDFHTNSVKPTKDKVRAMVQDLKKQVETREKSSRRRTFDADEDITYINEKNRDFNKKISRAYDKYTAEIRDSFERGTAL